MSRISIIAAVDSRMAIGFQNKLLFWLPNDLKRFKALTTGNTIIMGRKTFESLPKGALPNRRNVVLSSNPAAECPGAEVFTSLEAALESCQAEEKVYIIGGASVYRQAISLADELCLTTSAVSHRIGRLEQQLALKLFHRMPRKVSLTDAGRALREKALPMNLVAATGLPSDEFDKLQKAVVTLRDNLRDHAQAQSR